MQCLVLVVVTVTEVYSVAMVTSQVKVTRENVFSCHSNHQHGTGPTAIDRSDLQWENRKEIKIRIRNISQDTRWTHNSFVCRMCWRKSWKHLITNIEGNPRAEDWGLFTQLHIETLIRLETADSFKPRITPGSWDWLPGTGFTGSVRVSLKTISSLTETFLS